MPAPGVAPRGGVSKLIGARWLYRRSKPVWPDADDGADTIGGGSGAPAAEPSGVLGTVGTMGVGSFRLMMRRPGEAV